MQFDGIKLIRFIRHSERKIKLLVICLLASITFWFILVLSNRYCMNVEVEIDLINIPDDKLVTMEEKIKKANLRLEGAGWELLLLKISHKSFVLKLDLWDLNSNEQVISLNQYRDQFNRQLSNNLYVSQIIPDKISINYLNRGEKRVPLELDIKVDFEKQYYYSDNIKQDIDSVTIYGPQNQLDNITSWKTSPIYLRNVKDSTTLRISLKPPKDESDLLRIIPDMANVTIPVEMFTEGTVYSNVSITNNSEQWNVTLIPNKVKVKFLYPLNKSSLITQDMFLVQVDMNQWTVDGDSKLDVKVVRHPDFIRLIKTDPSQVDFFIYK